MTREEKLEQIRASLRRPVFYASDFKDGNDAKVWWNRKYREASELELPRLKEWAKEMLEYLDDFSLYYIKDENKEFLEGIVDL